MVGARRPGEAARRPGGAMRFEWDAEKSARNTRERGLPFELVERMDWGAAVTLPDRRRDYGERRLVTLAPLAGRLHVCIDTLRDDAFLIISFRKANERERSFYEQRRPPPHHG
jgi:hypothetical protein